MLKKVPPIKAGNNYYYCVIKLLKNLTETYERTVGYYMKFTSEYGPGMNKK